MEGIKLANVIIAMLSLVFSGGVAWGTVKITQNFMVKKIADLELNQKNINLDLRTLKNTIEGYEKDKLDRLARMETKLDLILNGKIKE